MEGGAAVKFFFFPACQQIRLTVVASGVGGPEINVKQCFMHTGAVRGAVKMRRLSRGSFRAGTTPVKGKAAKSSLLWKPGGGAHIPALLTTP